MEKPLEAQSTVDRIMKSVRLLLKHSLIGAPLSPIADVDSGYRSLVSGNYMVLYRGTTLTCLLTVCRADAVTICVFCWATQLWVTRPNKGAIFPMPLKR